MIACPRTRGARTMRARAGAGAVTAGAGAAAGGEAAGGEAAGGEAAGATGVGVAVGAGAGGSRWSASTARLSSSRSIVEVTTGLRLVEPAAVGRGLARGTAFPHVRA